MTPQIKASLDRSVPSVSFELYTAKHAKCASDASFHGTPGKNGKHCNLAVFRRFYSNKVARSCLEALENEAPAHFACFAA